jgi:hypothetical protein
VYLANRARLRLDLMGGEARRWQARDSEALLARLDGCLGGPFESFAYAALFEFGAGC